MRYFFRLPSVFVFCVCFICGCSVPFVATPHTAEVKNVVIGVTNTYLTQILRGDEGRVLRLLYWPEFSKKAEITREQFHTYFTKAQARWTGDKHPLLGLKVLEVSGSGNFARIRLQRANNSSQSPAYPEISVDLMWASTGWVITGDSLFGPGRLFDLP